MTILGWVSLSLIALGGFGVVQGMSGDSSNAEARMSDAIMTMFSLLPLGAGLLLGLLWLILK
jgi:hypothetical protein